METTIGHQVICLGPRSSFVFREMALSGFTCRPTSTWGFKWVAVWQESGKDHLDASCTQSHPPLSLVLCPSTQGRALLLWAEWIARPCSASSRCSPARNRWMRLGVHQHLLGCVQVGACHPRKGPHFQSPGVGTVCQHLAV